MRGFQPSSSPSSLCRSTFLQLLLLMASFLCSLVGADTSCRPSIILVHGAWHQPTCWGKVVHELQQAEYVNIATPDLPSIGHVVGRDADVAVVKSALETELSAGRDVLLVGHSYGGAVISEAVKEFQNSSSKKATLISRAVEVVASLLYRNTRGRVLGLVYLAGYLPLISDVEDPSSKPDIKTVSPKFVRFDGDKTFPDGDLDNNPPEKIFYNDLSPEEAEFWVQQLDFSSYPALNGTPTYIPYTGDFKCTYVLCDLDNAVPAAWSQQYLSQTGAQFEIERLNSSHSAMLSRPKEVAEIIRRAANEQGI